MKRPEVRAEDGELVLHDEFAGGVMNAVAKENCVATLNANLERVRHFRSRIAERGDDPDHVLIVVISVDDIHGSLLADALMPGFDWGRIRARGQKPYARGLAERAGIQAFLDKLDPAEGARLRELDIACVVVDHGTCKVFRVAR